MRPPRISEVPAALRHGGIGLYLVASVLLAACGGSSPGVDPIPIEVAANGASRPAVAVDQLSGTIYVGWAVPDPRTKGYFQDHAGTLFIARSTDGGKTFSKPVQVGERGEASFGGPVLRAYGAGKLLVAWEHKDPTRTLEVLPKAADHAKDYTPDPSDNRIRVARSTDGGQTFSLPVEVVSHPSPIKGTMPSLTVLEDSQTVVVSWLDYTGKFGSGAIGGERQPTPILVAVSTDAGATFDEPVVANPQSCSCCPPMLTMFQGRPALVWRGHERESDAWDLRDTMLALAAADGHTWSSSIKVYDDHWRFNACPVVGPAIATDKEGRLHVAWYTAAEGRAGFWYAHSQDGRSFSAPLALSNTPAPPALNDVTLDIDINGMAWIGTVDLTQGESQISVWRLPKVGTTAVLAARLAGNPSIAADRVGAVLVWSDGKGKVLLQRLGGNRK